MATARGDEGAPSDLAGAGGRERVQAEVRSFKASWTGLARVLSEVERAGAWRGWGFESFAQYCRKELRLKSETVAKLTRSYAFLAAHQGPKAEPGTHLPGAPPLDVVDLLARAPQAAQLPTEAYQSTVSEVLGGTPLSKGQLLRRLRQHDPDAFRVAGAHSALAVPAEAEGGIDDAELADAALPAADAADSGLQPAPSVDPQALRKTLALAARLVELVEGLSLGALPGRHARAVVRELKERVAEHGRQGAA